MLFHDFDLAGGHCPERILMALRRDAGTAAGMNCDRTLGQKRLEQQCIGDDADIRTYAGKLYARRALESQLLGQRPAGRRPAGAAIQAGICVPLQ